MTPQQLVQRREELHQTIRDAEDELVAVEGALAMHGARRPGRPRKTSAYSDDVALKAHRLYRAGVRTAWVVDANRQYERQRRRAYRRANAQERA